jgi:Flp pilus assembly protein TadG
MLANRADRTCRRRRGRFALELLLVLPILLALVAGMVEFSLLLGARQQLVAASREGARVAAQGGDPMEVDRAVRTFLGQGSLQAAQVQSVLTDAAGNPLSTGDSVQVVVQLPATQAAPDLLAFVGVSLHDQVLVARTVMRKE